MPNYSILCSINKVILVAVVDIKWYGSTGVELTFKDATGRPDSVLLYRDSEPGLKIVSAERSWSFDADGAALRLVSEAYRIHLACWSETSAAIQGPGNSRDNVSGFDAGNLSRQLVREQLALEERALARRAMGSSREPDIWGGKRRGTVPQY